MKTGDWVSNSAGFPMPTSFPSEDPARTAGMLLHCSTPVTRFRFEPSPTNWYPAGNPGIFIA
jgi:hypothetical protein